MVLYVFGIMLINWRNKYVQPNRH